jgi:hypothetical protein
MEKKGFRKDLSNTFSGGGNLPMTAAVFFDDVNGMAPVTSRTTPTTRGTIMSWR